ncbi:unnamed protein product, partial [Staurois parvus]
MGPYTPLLHAAAKALICHGPLYRLLMLHAKTRVSHGSLYGPSIAAVSPHRHTLAMCHFQVSSHTAGVFEFFVIGCWQLRAPYCCCQAHNLPMGPIYASSCCCQVQSLSWSCTVLPLWLSPSPQLLPCATFRSPHHCWCVSI